MALVGSEFCVLTGVKTTAGCSCCSLVITEGFDEGVVTVAAGCVSIECIILEFDCAGVPRPLTPDGGWPAKDSGTVVFIGGIAFAKNPVCFPVGIPGIVDGVLGLLTCWLFCVSTGIGVLLTGWLM